MNSAPTFSELTNSLSLTDGESWAVDITDNWMQGRTTYGGLSSALCLQAVLNDYPDLPPLRSAQINFTGPVGGAVSIRTRTLSLGRSVNFISAELFGEKGLAVHAVFCFAKQRESKLNNIYTKPPKKPTADMSESLFSNGSSGYPAFILNYECKLVSDALPYSGSSTHENFYWVKHKDQNATNVVALLGLADMAPPAASSMFTEPAPSSSMTWMLNFIGDADEQQSNNNDGWWLVRSATEHAQDGYSSQDMQVWNSNQELVISGRQNVAIFY